MDEEWLVIRPQINIHTLERLIGEVTGYRQFFEDKLEGSTREVKDALFEFDNLIHRYRYSERAMKRVEFKQAVADIELGEDTRMRNVEYGAFSMASDKHELHVAVNEIAGRLKILLPALRKITRLCPSRCIESCVNSNTMHTGVLQEVYFICDTLEFKYDLSNFAKEFVGHVYQWIRNRLLYLGNRNMLQRRKIMRQRVENAQFCALEALFCFQDNTAILQLRILNGFLLLLQ